MARSSRKNAQLFVLNNEFSIYETGVYCRLSVEDNGKADGDSIENQKDYIKDYLKNNSEFHFHDFYIDNGRIYIECSEAATIRIHSDKHPTKVFNFDEGRGKIN